MKHTKLFFILCLLLNAHFVFAYTEIKEGNLIANPKQVLKDAKLNILKMDFSISLHESNLKKSIKSKKFETDELASDSHILAIEKEVNSPYGLKKIEDAKVLARFFIAKAISDRWSELSMSILNSTNTSSFLDFRIPLSKEIEKKLLYSRSYLPVGKKQVVHEFEFQEVATIRVRDDLKVYDFIFEINSASDSNKLDPVAPKITVAE